MKKRSKIYFAKKYLEKALEGFVLSNTPIPDLKIPIVSCSLNMPKPGEAEALVEKYDKMVSEQADFKDYK